MSLEVTTLVSGKPGLEACAALIAGQHHAVLVDTHFLVSDGRRLADRIQNRNVVLDTILVTQPHSDHWFGYEGLRETFPDASLVAPQNVAGECARTGQLKSDRWRSTHGDNVPAVPTPPAPLTDDHVELEGHRIEIIELPMADTAPHAVVWIPDVRTVVAGDLAFDGCHVFLGEHDAEGRDLFKASIDWVLDTLRPDRVIAGHLAGPGREAAGQNLRDTRAYIQYAEALGQEGLDADRLAARLRGAHPDYGLDFAVAPTAAAIVDGQYTEQQKAHAWVSLPSR